MTLSPTPQERVMRARADLRIGLPVVVHHDGMRWMAMAAELITPERLNALRDLGRAELALTARRAGTLNLAAYDGEAARIALPSDATPKWVRAMADPADDLRHPMKGPFTPVRGGDATAARAALALCKGAQLLPAGVLVALTAVHCVPDLTEVDATQALLDHPPTPDPVASAGLPMALAGAGRLHVYRDGQEDHYAIEVGPLDRAQPVLCRLHSACFTGDVLGSLKCDCGPQLHAALEAMRETGGILLYLNQEGRGIGLANKMRAYDLQDQGFDTVEANHRLGFEDDERDFRLGARMLHRMGVSQVRLLTNNPRKVARMQDTGITVAARVPLQVGRNPHNADYLATKAAKSGHLL